MQNEVTIIIDLNTGNGVYLLTDAGKTLTCFDASKKRRASHVFPRNFILRTLFRILRCWLGDKGRMSEFTRSWKCAWIIDTSPVGGPILNGIWYDRRAAIDAEVEYLNKFFISRETL